MGRSQQWRVLGGLMVLAGCLAAASCHRADEGLRWAADAEGGAPYIFKDPKDPNRHIGFEVELAEALGNELGQKIVFQQYEFASLVPGLERGDEFDFAMNGLEITPDRQKVILFSQPYYVYRLQLVVRADETQLATLADCRAAGIEVGTLEDTAALRLLEKEHLRPKPYSNQVDPYRDLELGRIRAVFMDLPIAIYYAKPNPRLKFAGDPIAPGYYAIGFRKDQAALAGQFNAALERLAQRGELQRIYEKWGLWDEEQKMLFGGSKGVMTDVVEQSRQEFTPAKYLPLLLAGAWVTIQLSVLSMALAVTIGLPVALARKYGSPWLRAPAVAYVEFFRGIPVLLLLFFVYYALPELGQRWGYEDALKMPAFYAAILAFGLNYGAYEAEIYRAGLGAIPVGQWEAAASLGMSRFLTFRRIILPQAIRIILPPMTNDFIALFKDTSVVSLIAVVELTKQYQMLSKSSMKYLELGAVTALLYLIMSVPLGYLSRYLEKRWGKGV